MRHCLAQQQSCHDNLSVFILQGSIGYSYFVLFACGRRLPNTQEDLSMHKDRNEGWASAPWLCCNECYVAMNAMLCWGGSPIRWAQVAPWQTLHAQPYILDIHLDGQGG